MSELIPIGAVIYTDGSARPNPGFYGSGMHGYTYIYPDEKKKATRVNAWQATDKGYILQKDLLQSDAKPVHIVNYLDCFQSYDSAGSNNLAEINAFNLLFENFDGLHNSLQKIHVLADSKYFIGGITQWVKGWKRNGWLSSQGKPVSNREAWEHSHDLAEDYRGKGQLVVDWVRGHNDDYGNVKADYLAKIGTAYSTDGQVLVYKDVADPLRYNKADVDLHPLLGLKRVYFNTDPEFNTPGTYYQTGWSGNDHITGKRTPEASFSVVKLNTPDPAIETIIDAQYRVPADFNNIIYIKLDRVRSPEIYPYLREHGRYCLYNAKKNQNLDFLDEKPVTIEVLAGELPHRSIEVLNVLEDILDRFTSEYLVNGQMDESVYHYRAHSLTDHFYDHGTKKVGKTEIDTWTLKKEFKVGVLSTSVMVQEPVEGKLQDLHLPLVFQDDIPSRNTLKNLETLSPKVFLITWKESNKLLRYSTVIQTTEGIGIWSNHFANQLLLKPAKTP